MGVGNSVRMTTLALMLGATLGVSGCAIMGGGDGSSEPTAAELTSQADAKASAGEDDAAVALLKKVTLKNPVDPDPWLKIARIRFESDDYVDALVASEEVISRDQTNEAGNSIALVSSLRLAERSIGLLRSGTDLEGSMRDRAQQLAAQLRETLGEDALLPASAQGHSSHRSTHRTVHHSTRRRSHKSTTHKATSHNTTPKTPSGSASSSSGDTQKDNASGNGNSPAEQNNKSDDDGSMNPFETLQKLPQ